MSATNTALGFAALSSQLNVNSEASNVVGEDGYIQALPDGHFASVDGRPDDVAGGKWLMDSVAFAALQANTPHKAGDLVIDYEHQTLNKEVNGQPAPAAGWFNITDVQYREGHGLFIKPRFTDNATAFLSAKEYKYFSLVFGYDKATGRPQFIHSAALTNRPGVDGMLPLASLAALSTLNANDLQSTPSEGLHVNPLILKLLAALGIEIAEGSEPTEAQLNDALKRIDDLVKAAGSVDGLKQEVAALSAKSPTIDLTKYVPIATVNALREQLVALTAENGVLTVEQTVKAAIDEGKAFECERQYLIDLGKQSMAALTANLGERVAIAALTAKQTTTVDKPEKKDPQLAALTAEDKSVAAQMGLSLEQMAAAKKASV